MPPDDSNGLPRLAPGGYPRTPTIVLGPRRGDGVLDRNVQRQQPVRALPFRPHVPGDRARKSLVGEDWGYLPQYDPDLIDLFNPEQRDLAARALSNDGTEWPDVVCLQEVESLLGLRKFNEEHMGGHYRYALLVDSRDFRQIDVGILSNLEITGVRSNVDALDPQPEKKNPFLFSRDCLEVTLALSKTRDLTLFVNHLKSKYAETAAERKRGDALRLRQATAVAAIVKARFPGTAFKKSLFAVLGDLNDQPASPCLAPLYSMGLVDAFARIAPEEQRWTHWYRSENSLSQLDHLLLSPALAKSAPSAPRIDRRAIGFSRILQDGKPGPKLSHFQHVDGDPNPIDVDFRFARFKGVGPEVYGSDHAAVVLGI